MSKRRRTFFPGALMRKVERDGWSSLRHSSEVEAALKKRELTKKEITT